MERQPSRRRARRLFSLGLILTALVLLAAGDADDKSAPESPPAVKQAADQEPTTSAEASPRIARLVRIPLPIGDTTDTAVMRSIDQLLDELPKNSESRPVLVLEFYVKEGMSSEGSQFERALALARYLASEKLSRVRTVAYLPNSVKGHAVLVALACEEIVMHPDARLGEAGIDENFIDRTIRQIYTEIAERRRIIPTPVVLGMLDKQLEVFRVKTLDGPRYVLAPELKELEQAAAVASVETIIPAGTLGSFSGSELRQTHRFVSYLASDRAELANVLELPAGALEQDPSLGGKWNALRVDLRGPINHKFINWIERGLTDKLARGEYNFVCIWIDSPGGSPIASMQLAGFLADLDSGKVRTVAYVPRQARADAALIAFACDHLVVHDKAILGGSGDKAIDKGEQQDLLPPIQKLAGKKYRNWSLPAALVNPELKVFRYHREGYEEARLLSEAEAGEFKDADKWVRGAEVETRQGIKGKAAEQLRLARYLAGNFDEFKQLYHLDQEPESLRPNWAHELVERLASPMVRSWLLFLAFFFLFVEFMQPGLSVAGFISGVCFLLFFWAQFLHGTAGWLEILLFLGGALCIVIELFVTPGTGVFGVGGGTLIIVSVVLASQTFIIPRNTYQLEQLPYSLATVLAGVAGGVTSLVIMRRFLPDAPFFKRMMLKPPAADQLEDLDRRESLTSFNHLHGKRGVATTQLTPSGKARFGDELFDVISSGEMIPRGAALYVAEVRGSHIVVKAIEPGRE